MADNLTTQSTALATVPASSVIATDDIGGVHYQKFKLALGADGAVDNLVDSGQQASSASVPAVLSTEQEAILSAIQAAVEGTLTVGSHAVTNAGTFAVQVDGSALTALQLIDNIVLAEDAIHQTGDAGVMLLAVRQDTQSDFGADGDYVPLSITAAGELRVTNAAGSGGTSETDDAAFTAATDAGTPMMGFATSDAVDAGDVGVVAMSTDRRLHTDANVQQGNSDVGSGNPLEVTLANGSVPSHAVTNAGTFAVQTELPAAVTAADDLANPSAPSVLAHLMGLDTSGTWDRVRVTNGNNDAFAATSIGTITIPYNLMYNGTSWDRIRGDTSNGLDVDVTRIAAGSNLIGDVGIQGRTSGGLTTFRSIDLDESEEEIKATAGTLYGALLQNLGAATLYVKFYNATAATVVVGTTTPLITLPVPADEMPHGFMIPQGVDFGTAITTAATTGLADNDTGAPGANEMVAHVFYK